MGGCLADGGAPHSSEALTSDPYRTLFSGALSVLSLRPLCQSEALWSGRTREPSRWVASSWTRSTTQVTGLYVSS